MASLRRMLAGTAMALVVVALSARASPPSLRRRGRHQDPRHSGLHRHLHHGPLVHDDQVSRVCAESKEATLAFYTHHSDDGPAFSYIEEEMGGVGSWEPRYRHPALLCPAVTRGRDVGVSEAGATRRFYFEESRCEQPGEAVRTDPATGLVYKCVTLVRRRNLTDAVGLCGPVGCAVQVQEAATVPRRAPPPEPDYTLEGWASDTERRRRCSSAAESHAFVKAIHQDLDSIHFLEIEMQPQGNWTQPNPRQLWDNVHSHVCPTEYRVRMVGVPGSTDELHYVERRCAYRGSDSAVLAAFVAGGVRFRCVDLHARQDLYADIEVCGPVGCSVERINPF